MEELELTLTLELEKRIFAKYFRFERKKRMRNASHYLIGIAISLALMVLGAYFFVVLLVVGLVLFLGCISLFAIFFLKFRRQQAYLNKQLETTIDKDATLYFSFDENGFTIRTKDYKLTYNWTLLHQFKENSGDLYLFNERNNLVNLISEEKIGSENYARFRELLVKNLT